MEGNYSDGEFGEQTIEDLKIELENEVRNRESAFWKPVLFGLVQISLKDIEESSPRRLMKLNIVADWKMQIETQRTREMFGNGT